MLERGFWQRPLPMPVDSAGALSLEVLQQRDGACLSERPGLGLVAQGPCPSPEPESPGRGTWALQVHPPACDHPILWPGPAATGSPSHLLACTSQQLNPAPHKGPR